MVRVLITAAFVSMSSIAQANEPEAPDASGIASAQAVEVSSDQPSTEEPSPPQKRPAFGRTFAPTGLLSEFNSNENFGNVQGRLGIYRTHQASANATGRESGYRDTVDNYIFPVKATIALPGENDDWFVRTAVTAAYARGKPGNLTRNSVDSYTGQLHIIRRLGDRSAMSFGVISTDAQIELLHNGGSISNTGFGLQIDGMHLLDDGFGIAGRLIYDWVERDIEVPLASGGSIATKLNGERVYAEGSLVLNFEHGSAPVVPEGWRLRSVLTGVYQSIDLGPAINSRGIEVPGSNEDFAAVFLTARLEKTDFRPWKLVPYVEVGGELTVANDASRVDDDPANTYLRAGLATNIGGAGRLDFYAIRRDSLDGSFSATNLSILLTSRF